MTGSSAHDRLFRIAAVASVAFLPLSAPIAAQQLSREEILRLADSQAVPALEMFREYLSIPNDAHYPEDILEIISWMDRAFTSRGFETTELPTDGSSLLLAKRKFAGASRTVLIYLQSDGQPVSPEDWNQEHPFKPVLKRQDDSGEWEEIDWSRIRGELDDDWRIFARSASDSKGPNIQLLAALDAMEQGGVTPDFNIKVIVDTEEEMGSPHLPAAVERFRDELAADMLVILDGPPHISVAPTLKFGARGISTFTLTTYGPRVPQHSGHYGNYAPNPGLRLAQLLASMKSENGRVTIPGFYDGVEIDADTRAILDGVPDDEPAIMEQLGIAVTDDVGGSLQEAVQYPSLNVRGCRLDGSESRAER